jgi:hypothetical protein
MLALNWNISSNFGGLHRKDELYKKYTDCHWFKYLVHEIVPMEQFKEQKTSKSNQMSHFGLIQEILRRSH